MKKWLRIGLFVLGGGVLLVGLGAGVVHFRGIPRYTTKTVDFKVNATPEKIEKGLKLVTTLCTSCHLDKKTGGLTGQQMFDTPPEFGKVFAVNITQDKEFGIGKWTDGQLAYLFRTGIRPDGQYTPPYMPKLIHTSDEDLEAIIAFLRSDHNLVKARPVKNTPSEISFLTKFLCQTNQDFQPFEYPEKSIKAPDTTDIVKFGEYLIKSYDCYGCHSSSFQTMNLREPHKSKGYFGGGNKIYDLAGKQVITPNLTPDKETGTGNWTEKMFTDALRYAKNPRGGEALKYPMFPYSRLTDYEAKAIFEYFKTIPPIKNKVR